MAPWRWILTFALLIALAALVALEAGVWTRTQVEHGPFKAEEGAAVLVPVEGAPWGRCCFSARTDSVETPLESRLRVWVGESEYREPHAGHATIRGGKVGAFSNWVDALRLALPPDQANDETASVRMVYPVQIRSRMLSLALIAAAGFGLAGAVGGPPLRRLLTSRNVSRVLPWATLVAAVSMSALAALAGVYGVLTIVAWMQGWALPSTSGIVHFSLFRRLAMAEPHASEAILGLALVGTLTAWVAGFYRVDQSASERRVIKLLGFAGPVILVVLLVFSASAQWAGLWREGDVSSAAIAGLVPFNDANGYYHDAHQVVNTGYFGSMGARRPLAQTFRTTLMTFGGFNYSAMVLLQSLMVGLAIFFASRSVARWRGLWAGLAFAALSYAVAREFVTTALTESLGLFWGLCAIPPFVRALRDRSAGHALLGTGLLDVALLTRMGSMFTMLALPLWIALSFGKTKLAKLRLLAASILVLLGVLGVNFIEAKIYTTDVEEVGSNFSYTLCGLTIGATWGDCEDRYIHELTPAQVGQPMAVEHLMYQKAFENFVAHPSVFFKRVFDASCAFLKDLPGILTSGYKAITPAYSWDLQLLEIVVLIGLVRLIPRMQRHELVFWGLFWVSGIVSAGFVFFDDGRRVMIAIYPVAILFFASGLWTARPEPSAPARPRLPSLTARASFGAVAAMALLLVCLLTPYAMHRFAPPSDYVSSDYASSQRLERGETTMFMAGASSMAGLLVVADDVPLPTQVPSMHVSDFAKIVRISGIEDYQSLVTPSPPPVPFAFVAGRDLVRGQEENRFFVAPPSVLLRKDVPAWRFDTALFGTTTFGDSYWLDVTDAEPLKQQESRK